jgi:DnaK suppressor protein
MSLENPGLSKDFVNGQRKLLESLREQLLDAASVASERDRQDENTNGPMDAADRAEVARERETDELLDKVTERRLRFIGRALEKIAEGTYGLSDASGEPIPKERLEKVPEAVHTTEEERAHESDSADDTITSGERTQQMNAKQRKSA